MGSHEKTYCCIDLKSFYASVECVDRGMDPFTTKLVVADPERTDKTICLAVSPALKALGLPGRLRVFEIPSSIDYLMARPRMRRYMEVSSQIVGIYLRFVSAEDIHVYSIDECFIDLTPYLSLYGVTAKEMVSMLRDAVFEETGITATAGVGPNLFLAKVALDVTAKHVPDGIGELDYLSFRQQIWHHRPITDIWQIGHGVASRLEKHNLFDLYDVAHANIDVLYREFGVNAEYLIDHAWGIEPCTIEDIHAYKPKANSLANGQVLPCDYSFEEGRTVVREMVDESVLSLVERRVVTDHIGLYVGYAHPRPRGQEGASGSVGRRMPLGATVRGKPRSLDPSGQNHLSISRKLPVATNSFEVLMPLIEGLYDAHVDPSRSLKRINVHFGNLVSEAFATQDLFSDTEAAAAERSRQEAVLAIQRKFGKASIVRGTSLKDKARGIERAGQVGGHHA